MNNQIRLAVPSASTLAAMLFLSAQPAHGQATDPDPAAQEPAGVATPGDEANEAVSAGDIIVTANKQAERLSTVPAAVTAVTTADLNTAGVTSARDLASVIPSLSTSGGYGSTSFNIRGINTGVDNSPTVGIQIDGVPVGPTPIFSLGAAILPQIDASMLSRIEVLRGPQGTLYAGSTLGGIVNYVTVEPNLARWRDGFYLEGSKPKHGDLGGTARGMVTGPIVADQVGVALSGFVIRQGGFIDAPQAGRDDYNYNRAFGGRLSLLWQVTPEFSVQLSDIYSDVRSFADDMIGGANSDLVQPDLTYPLVVLPRYKNRSNIAMLKLRGAFDWGELNYIGSLQHADTTFVIPQPDVSALAGLVRNVLPAFGGVAVPANIGIGVDGPGDFDKTTHEIRFSSPTERTLQWTVGAFYNHEDNKAANIVSQFTADQRLAATPDAELLIFDLPTKVKEISGFGQVTFAATSKLDITVGIRVQKISQDYRQGFGGSDANAYNALFGILGFDITPADSGLIEDSQTSTTYLANVRYRFRPDTMVYARYATGFRAGGPNANAVGIPPNFGPDKTDNYEIGLKSDVLDGRGYVELTAFHIDWKDIQVLTVGPGGTGGQVNGGRARSRGVEASINLRPVEGLTIDSWLTYNDTKLTDDIITGSGTIGLRGDTLPNVPKWSAFFSGQYEWPLGGDTNGFVGGSIRYTGSRFNAPPSSTNARPLYRLPSYTMADVRAGVRWGSYEAALFVRNVGDSRAQLSAAGIGVPLVTIARPRTFGASLSRNF